MADEFDFTLGTDDDGNVIDTTQPPDDGGMSDDFGVNDPNKFGAAFVYNPKTGLYTQTLYDGSTIVQDVSGNIVDSSGSVLDSGGSGVAGAGGGAGKSIADLAKSLPEQAWNAIKSAFTKKTQKIGADGKPIPNEFDESVDWKALAAAGGGIAGLATNLMNKDKPAPITGYQGKIPTLNAVQQQVPGTYDPTRRPGSSGQRYLTDMKYADPTVAAAAQTAAGEQATGLAALNAANPAMQKIQKSPEGKVIPDSMVSKPYAAPASSVIDRLAPTMKGLESLVNPPTQTPLLETPSPKPAPQYDPNDTRPIYPGPDKTGLTGGPAQPSGGWRGSDIPFTPPYVEKEPTPSRLSDIAPTDIMAAVKAANPNLEIGRAHV